MTFPHASAVTKDRNGTFEIAPERLVSRLEKCQYRQTVLTSSKFSVCLRKVSQILGESSLKQRDWVNSPFVFT